MAFIFEAVFYSFSKMSIWYNYKVKKLCPTIAYSIICPIHDKIASYSIICSINSKCVFFKKCFLFLSFI